MEFVCKPGQIPDKGRGLLSTCRITNVKPMNMLPLRLPLVFVVWMNILFVVVLGHGRMLDPPGRSSMWRVGFDTPVNFDDNRLNCGNRNQPLEFLSGNCGLCGDPFDQNPRENEAGGKFATGIISKHYNMAAIITIKMQIKSSNDGFFEFRLCENNDMTKRITKKCLKHLLVNPETGETRYPVAASAHYIEVSAKLPADVTCSQCVLQWRYRTGNTVRNTDENCESCGDQEEFYACSDIAITDTPTKAIRSKPDFPPSPNTATSLEPFQQFKDKCVHFVSVSGNSHDSWCKRNCEHSPSHCPIWLCKCATSPTATTTPPTTTNPTTTTPTTTGSTASTVPSTVPSGARNCVSVSGSTHDHWCFLNCNHAPIFCPTWLCTCSIPSTPTTTTTTTPTTTTTTPTTTTTTPTTTTTTPTTTTTTPTTTAPTTTLP